MLDEKDLQAIQKLIKTEINASERRTTAMMEAYFNPKFELLLDKMNLITEAHQNHEERIARLEILNNIF